MFQALINDIALIHPFLGQVAQWMLLLILIALFGIVALFAWFILSLLAYLLEKGISPPLLRFANAARSLGKVFIEYAVSLKARALSAPSIFIETMKLRLVFDHNEQVLLGVLTKIAAESRFDLDALDQSHKTLAANSKALVKVCRVIADSESPPPAISVPQPGALIAEEQDRAAAWITFCTGAVFGALLIVLNSFLLNEFFKGIIQVHVSGIPVSMLITVALSLVEFGAGFWLYSSQRRQQLSGDVLAVIGSFLPLGVILGLIGLEFFFYALVAAEIDVEVLRPLFSPDPVPRWARMLFGLIGPVIVLVLAYAGHEFIDGLHRIRHSRAARTAAKQLKQIRASRQATLDLCEQARARGRALVGMLEDYERQYQRSAEGNPGFLEKLSDRMSAIAKASETAQKARRNPYSEVPEPELKRLYYIGITLTIVASLVAAMFVWLEARFLMRLGFLQGAPVLIVVGVALVEAGILLVASHSLTPTVRVVLERTPSPEVYEGPKNRIVQVVSWIAILAVVVFNALLTLKENSHSEWLWFSLSVACTGGLFLVGRQLSTIVSATRSILQFLVLGATSSLVGVTSAFIAATALLALLTIAALQLLAYPSTWWIERRYRIGRKLEERSAS
jgi:hypothetical protein